MYKNLVLLILVKCIDLAGNNTVNNNSVCHLPDNGPQYSANTAESHVAVPSLFRIAQ